MALKQRVEKQLKIIDQTKSWLAAQLGVEKQGLNNWLVREKIPEAYLFNAARLLNCDPEWLATGAKFDVRDADSHYEDGAISAALELLNQLDETHREEALRQLRILVRAQGF